MLRESILNHLKELRLDGMRMAYDEIFAIGQKRGDTAEKLLLSLLDAEMTERAGVVCVIVLGKLVSLSRKSLRTLISLSPR